MPFPASNQSFDFNLRANRAAFSSVRPMFWRNYFHSESREIVNMMAFAGRVKPGAGWPVTGRATPVMGTSSTR